MPPSLFSSGGSLFRSSRQFEIRLDQPYVVFEGTPEEGAQPVALTGSVHLNYRKPMGIKRIRVKLVGTLKLYWEFGWEPGEITKRTDTIYEKELVLLPVGDVDASSVHTIGAGPQDYSFRFELPPDTHDTVTGLKRDGWRHHIMVDWTLSATVERGFGSKDLSTSRKIRVMRVEGSNPDIFDHEQVHESIWNDKLSYKVCVPRVNHIFGTAITAQFQLTPLKKGVSIRDIQMELRENTVNIYDDSRRNPGQEVHQKDWYIVVARKTFPMPASSERRVAPDSTALLDEAHVFETKLDLPQSLRDCRQYVDTQNVKIFHTLRIFVNILNPDGHVSQLKVRAIINLYLSPQLDINETTLRVSLPESASTRESLLQPTSQEAPPTYSLHHLDPVYDGSDGSGAPTAQPRTGTNTPVFYTQSRRASIENLRQNVRMAGMVARTRSHDASAGPSVPDLANQIVSASALLSRLSNLPERAAQALPFTGRPRDSPSPTRGQASGEAVNTAATRQSTGLHSRGTPPSGSRHHSRRSSLQVSFQEPSSRPSGSDHSSQSALPSSRTSYIAEHSDRARPPPIPNHSGDAAADDDDDDAAPDDALLPYDIEALCKTPSYNTALRTPAPGSPADEHRGLPTYLAAVSRPSTPPSGARASGEGSRTPPQGAGTGQRVAPAMERSESGSSSNSRGSARSAGSADGDPDAGRGLLHRLRGRATGEAGDRRRSPPAGENEMRRDDTDDDLYG